MSELRRNPLTGQWVIIAPARGSRPHEFEQAARRGAVPSHDERCPFCPGNEAETPPPVLEVPDPATPGGWLVRGFPNKYAALSPDASPPLNDNKLLRSLRGVGAHEVIVETPLHNGFPASRTAAEMLRLIQAYRQRCGELAANRSTQYMLVFKNHGEAAGTSLVHPHSQIIAAPIVPETVRRSHELAKEHQQRSARCLLCDVLAEEIQGGERMVSRDERFAVFHPFAAARRAETWIVPLQHQAVFQELGDDAAEGFARILGRTLAQLSAAFGDPDFNYAIHSAPRPGAHDPYLHWYLQLIPRMTKAAGFELGSGIFINTSPPEVAAAQMRSAAL